MALESVREGRKLLFVLAQDRSWWCTGLCNVLLFKTVFPLQSSGLQSAGPYVA